MNSPAASLSVVGVGARSRPWLSAVSASARHAFAAASLGTVLRIFFSSRLLNTHAS